jgi:hypothetical protein
MAWCAETDQGQLGSGTVLSIFEEPWGPDLPVRQLPSGASLALQFSQRSCYQDRVHVAHRLTNSPTNDRAC